MACARMSGSARRTCASWIASEDLSGQARIDAAAAFAHRIASEETLVVPYGYGVEPFFISERIGCGFVQPAIAAVDLLSLCVEDGTAALSPSPGTSASP